MAVPVRPIGEDGRVRKQYHFWPGEHGLDAWDVDRLIELTRGFEIVEVPVDGIDEVDTVYWFDDREQRPTVRRVVEHFRLTQQVDPSIPIILGPDGRVMDGMHRIARAILEQRDTIAAVRFDDLPEPDYRGCRSEDLPHDR